MRRIVANRVLVGTLLLPTVFGALVLWSLGHRADSSDRVPAAVVNLDRPVTQGSGSDRQIIYAGRLLAGGLTSPTRRTDSDLGWRLTDASDARRGLRDGDYYAVVTIPRGFSRTLAGLTDDDPRAATVAVQSNDSSTGLAREVSRQVDDVAVAKLGHRVTATVLEGVLGRTGELKGRLGRAADGAGRLADGADRLAGGVDRLASGSDRLAGGLGRLAGGADRLAGGADRLHDGTAKLAGGADRLASGTGRLAGGLATLGRRTDPLPGQTRRLADGARQVSGGVGPYTRLVKAWEQACLTDPVVTAAHPQLCAATTRAAGPAGRTADRLAGGARQVADGAGLLAAAAPRLTASIDRAGHGARRVAGGAGRLAVGAHRLDTGAADLATGAHRLAGGAGRAGDGARALAGGSGRLAAGSGRLSAGNRTLASGLRDGAAKIPAASNGKHRARVVADPVHATSSSLHPEHDGTTVLVPAVLALALWLGAFVTYLVRRPLPERRLRAASTGRRLAVAGWLPAAGIGVVQAAVLFATVAVLGADLAAPLGVAGLLVVAAAVFAAVGQAFVAVLGPQRGWIVLIAFTVLQAVSLGGPVPVATAPGPLRWLDAVLPVSRAADGLGRLTLGGHVGSPAADLLVLLVWGAGGLLVTTLAARRRQRVTLDDVRRQLVAAPGAR